MDRISRRMTRREFLKDTGLVLGGAASGVAGIKFFLAHQNARMEVPKANGHIVQLSMDESVCTGCGTCEVVCSAAHGQSVGPSVRRIWLEKDTTNLVYHVLSCLQCDFPGCYYACPQKDRALSIDKNIKARFVFTKNCPPGCTECIKGCSMEPPRINYDTENRAVAMCDLCKDRAKGPACVEYCPSQCLHFKAYRP